jgi:hypothetical protein
MVKLGFWDFEPERVEGHLFPSTDAAPGSKTKIQVMAQRVTLGLPLWHPGDRSAYDGRVEE